MRRAALAGSVAAAFAVLPGLGTGTLWENSETTYGEVAREVLVYGDPVLMHFNGVPWFVQPPLYFWIAAAFGAAAGGASEFALRLPSALATIAACALLAFAVARACGERAGAVAGAVLATMVMESVLGRMAVMDALLDACVEATILAWFFALRGGGAWLWIAGSGAAALGVLAKGPVALLIPLLVIALWALWLGRAGARLVPAPAGAVVASLALAVAIVAPWAIAVSRAAGPRALAELVAHYSFGRFTGVIENQSGPFWYYVPVLILATFPWTPYLVPAFATALRKRVGAASDLRRLGVVWTAVPFLFFSAAATKLPNYLALELPGCALLVALWFEDALRPEARGIVRVSAWLPLALGALWLGVALFARSNRLEGAQHDLLAPVALFGAPLLAGAIVAFVLAARRAARRALPFALAASAIAAYAAGALAVEPAAERFKAIPPLAAAIERDAHPGDEIALQGASGGSSLVFYTRPHVYMLALPAARAPHRTNDPHTVECRAARVYVVVPRKRAFAIPTFGRRLVTIARDERDEALRFEGPCPDAPPAVRFRWPLPPAEVGAD